MDKLLKVGSSFVCLAIALTAATPGREPVQATEVTTVVIDIKPGDEPTTVEPDRGGMLPVAILSDDFDATTVDPETVRFGATGTEAVPVRSATEDVDGDGDEDMILLFRNEDTGIRCGDDSASLRGRTRDGESIEGTEGIKTVGCSG